MPTAVVTTVKVSFLSESVHLFLQCRTANRQLVGQFRERDVRMGADNAKQFFSILASEANPLPVIPPGVHIRISYNIDIALHLLAHRLAEVCQISSIFISVPPF